MKIKIRDDIYDIDDISYINYNPGLYSFRIIFKSFEIIEYYYISYNKMRKIFNKLDWLIRAKKLMDERKEV